MKAVLLTGAGIAVVDGIVLGVALGVGNTAVAATTLAVGLASAVVLGWLTPAARTPERALVTLGGQPVPQPTEPTPDLPPVAVLGPVTATAPAGLEPEPAPQRALPPQPPRDPETVAPALVH